MTDTLKPDNIGNLPVQKVTDIPVAFNMLVYGESGVGKTVLAGSAADVPAMGRVLFVDMEGGTLSIRSRYPSIDVVRVQSMTDMMTVYNALRSGKTEYDTVCIDSLTEVQKFAMNDIMRGVLSEDPDRDPDIPSLREYGKNLEQIRRFVRAFRDLPLNTIFTALAQTVKDDKTGKVVTRPGLTGKAASEVTAFLDVVLYMYTKTVDEEDQRLCLTKQTERVIAKDRTGSLPDIVVNPTMELIYNQAFFPTENDN